MTLLILLTILFLILLVCGSIAGLIAYFSTKKLQEHLITLNAQITTLKAALKQAQQGETSLKQSTDKNIISQSLSHHTPQTHILQEAQTAAYTHSQSTTKIPKDTSKPTQILQSQSLKKKDFFDFEWLFTQRVMVFLAGIFFIFAAFFLIRYSLEHNLLTPAVRISLCIGFGIILFVSGISLHYLQHHSIFYRIYNLALHHLRRIANIQPQPLNTSTSYFSLPHLTLQIIAQTLVGSSFVVLFFSFYGGFKIYGFFGDFFTLITLSLIALIGLGLSVRFGVIIGIFGLLGGFATPILLSSGYYNAPFLFGYLGIFYIISMYCVLRYA